MADFRQIPKTAIISVDPEEYEKEREWRRRTHHIREGEYVTIRTVYGFTDVAAIYDIRAVVESVEKYFIRLRYPAGFKAAFLWKDFEFIRMKD